MLMESLFSCFGSPMAYFLSKIQCKYNTLFNLCIFKVMTTKQSKTNVKIMGKKTFTILLSYFVFILTYDVCFYLCNCVGCRNFRIGSMNLFCL